MEGEQDKGGGDEGYGGGKGGEVEGMDGKIEGKRRGRNAGGWRARKQEGRMRVWKMQRESFEEEIGRG